MNERGPDSAGMYHGWKIVAALFVMLSFSSGLGFYNHAVMLGALTTEREFSVSVVSSAISIFFLASGLVGPALAVVIERYDVRWTICFGAILASAALYAIGRVQTEFWLFVAYIAFGIGFAASGLLPATTLVSRWFQKNRAVALSVASTGLSIGGVVVTPLSAFVIASLGIEDASPFMSALYLLGVVPLAILFVRSDPAELGLGMDGDVMEANASPHAGISFSRAIRMNYFWALGIAYIFVMAAQVGGIAHQYGVVSEQLSGRHAAMALAVLPLFSIFGRLAGGFVIDRVSTRRFTALMMLLQALSLLIISIAPSAWALVIGLALFGITVGNLLMLQPLLIAETFGLLNYSRIYSISNLLTMLGVAAGPVVMGIGFEVFGDYLFAYLFAAGSGLLALGIYLTVSPPRPAMP